MPGRWAQGIEQSVLQLMDSQTEIGEGCRPNVERAEQHYS